MKLSSLLAAALLVASAAATAKTPVNATCPITLRLPDVNTWKQTDGGFIKLFVSNPWSAAISNIVVSYTLPNGLTPLTTGGFIALAPGTGSGQARKAKSSRGAPAPVITNNGKTVTWTISSLAPNQKVTLAIGIRIDPGVRRSNTFRATATYTGPSGTPCNSQSNQYAVAARITPVGSIRTTGGAKTGSKGVTYQQYAGVYRLCHEAIKVVPSSNAQACATECNAQAACTSFVIFPTDLNAAQGTCRLYDALWGAALVYTDSAGNATVAGPTIFLRDPKPKALTGAACTLPLR